ncbi:MAG: DUF1929 domain-containing protein [Saprospiraceae bacterium]|nr:DUF1929 domain-containing protein [Saprospiraceae bacterium]
MLLKHLPLCLIFTSNILVAQYTIKGMITGQTQIISGARMTLFNSDTTYFIEERSDNFGMFYFSNVSAGAYKIGVAKSNYNYKESNIIINETNQDINFILDRETEKGKWDVIIKSPEPLGGTDLGVLMPNGKIYYCHDTKDPFYFDPKTNDTLSVMGSDSVQGCVGPILLADSTVWFFGGTLREIYGPGTKKVKKFDVRTTKWKTHQNMFDFRWYPSVSPLSNGQVIILGGGGLNNPIRVKTSEIYDPKSGISKPTGQIAIGNEVSPIVPLLNGKTLMTHCPPQLFDPTTNKWELAADFVQKNRMSNGDHSDHELVLMPDGDVFAFGYKPFNNNLGTFVEKYDVAANKWELKSSINPVRSRAKAIILPDKKILVAGGQKEDQNDVSPVNQWGYMKRSDLYHPETDTWRNLADLNYFREYHAILTLVPDGRIIAVGGEGQPGNEPPQSIIEAFKPPYLFRGVRPEISNLDKSNFSKGEELSFSVSKTDSITGLLLMANAVNTHFMNSSNNRFIELAFEQNNGKVTSLLPSDSLLLFDGFYMLFAMVDDIPSKAAIIQISGAKSIISNSNDIRNQEIVLCPNPTKDVVNCISNIPIIEIKLIDNSGRILLIKKDESIQSINLEGFEFGVYFVDMKLKDGSKIIRKISKIK